MRLFILEEVFELDNKMESVEEIFDYIKQALDETEYNFSYMIVDGREIYDEFEIYLEDNIKSIEQVKIVMLTTKEVVMDNLITIDAYVERAIPIIKKLADKFYKQPAEDDFKQIGELSEGIGFIHHTFNSIDSMENLNEIVPNYEVWNEYAKEVKTLEELVKQLSHSVKNKELVSIGDLLSSEIVSVFEKMNKKLGILVDRV